MYVDGWLKGRHYTSAAGRSYGGSQRSHPGGLWCSSGRCTLGSGRLWEGHQGRGVVYTKIFVMNARFSSVDLLRRSEVDGVPLLRETRTRKDTASYDHRPLRCRLRSAPRDSNTLRIVDCREGEQLVCGVIYDCYGL